MRRITMADVAERAGVSKATVSHVINETRFVEEATKSRVREAIDALGYRPNVAARSLTTQRTRIIGLIISDVTNTFFGELTRGIEDALFANGYSLMLCNTNEVLEREEYYIDVLLRQGVDGIIAAAASQDWDALNEAAKLNIPIVMLDRTFENADSPYVGVNNSQGAYLGTRHLIERGYREIGILSGFQRLSTMRERLAGFEQAMAEANLPLRARLVHRQPLNDRGWQARHAAIDGAGGAARRRLHLEQSFELGRLDGAAGDGTGLPR